MYENTYPKKRFQRTLQFLQKHISTHDQILDLGVDNPFSEIMRQNGYAVSNTSGEDLDNDQSAIEGFDGEVVTAFEIFEHLVAPYNVLKNIPCQKLVASVPLKLWFASAYRNPDDQWDQHYHEFEQWQFDYVLNKAGFEVQDSLTFTHPVGKLGFRPLLRKFTPRYYLVYAVKSPNKV
jgi:hypothetical protein